MDDISVMICDDSALMRNLIGRIIDETTGLTVCGTSPDGTLVEAVEIAENRFHVGVQFHPEFKSRPDKAHPLFREFIRCSLGEKN